MASDTTKVLITGGLGYVGGRIAVHLLSLAGKFDLRLMTRRSPEKSPSWAAGLDVVQADVTDSHALEAALKGVDTVVHLAAVNEIDSAEDPDLALEVNGRRTYLLLRACASRGVRRFIYFSTFHVYGPWATQPITEQTPTRPVHPYAFTHRLAEDYVNWYRHSGDIQTVVLRLSNGYGYPAGPAVDRWTLVFNDLCLQAVTKGEIVLRSTGSQHRDFIALSDVGRAVEHLIDLPGEMWGDGLFNLGGECSLSILEVAHRIAGEFSHCYGKDIPVTAAQAEISPPPEPVVFSIEKLKQTGFRPNGDMAKEIRGTFAVCQQLAQGEIKEP